MGRAQDIKELIRAIAGQGDGLMFVGEVKSVDGDSCTVAVGQLELTDVRLTAASDGEEGKLLLTPKEGSKVLVADLGSGTMRDLAVVGYTQVDKIEASCSQITLNGGGNGGLVKIEKLTERLNKIEQDINNLKTVFSTTWTVSPQDGGAALRTAASTWAGALLQETQVSDMEDTKVKH